MARNTGAFVFCIAAVIAAVGLPPSADAFGLGLEQLLAQKLSKHHGIAAHHPQPQPLQLPQVHVQYHYRPPQPRPLPPAYHPEPQPSYGGGCQHTQAAIVRPTPGPSYSGWGPAVVPAQQAAVAAPIPPPSGYLPNSNPNPQIDYSNYAVHGGHGFGNYGKYK